VKTSHGIAIDGFMGGSASAGQPQNKGYKITESSNLLNLNTKAAGTRIKSAAQGVHQRAQRSQTLMRGAVKKPAQAISSVASIPARPTQPKPRTASVDKFRVLRAESINRDAKIRRFGHVQEPAAAKPFNAAKEAPKKPSGSANTSSTSILYKPLPSMVASASHRQLERMLDEALSEADAHKKAFKANANLLQKIKYAPRWKSVGVVILAVLLLTAFVAWQKVPQIALRVASTRAHVSAHAPAYVPSGFSLSNPIKYNPGSVTVKYQANSDTSRDFILTQKAADMDSKSLKDSVVPNNSQVQTSTIQGTTVYIYGDSNDAAWTDHGMTYKIHNAANLNSDQLLKIAGSL
jgi:hypothetical protein